jgi:hypothetical protein
MLSIAGRPDERAFGERSVRGRSLKELIHVMSSTYYQRIVSQQAAENRTEGIQTMNITSLCICLKVCVLAPGHDLHELHALLAPRPFLVSGGEVDPPERWLALNHLIRINEVLGQSNRVGMANRPKHSPTRESNAVIYAFFEHFLQ